EDGIRDKLVTGVQTCALPISGDGYMFVTIRARIGGKLPGCGGSDPAVWHHAIDVRVARPARRRLRFRRRRTHSPARAARVAAHRSEERRVGKEGRIGVLADS